MASVTVVVVLSVLTAGCGGHTVAAIDAGAKLDASLGPCTSALGCSGNAEFCVAWVALDGAVAQSACVPQLEDRECDDKPDACTCSFCPGATLKCHINNYYGVLDLVECAAP
jgi:hypothetical protein